MWFGKCMGSVEGHSESIILILLGINSIDFIREKIMIQIMIQPGIINIMEMIWIMKTMMSKKNLIAKFVANFSIVGIISQDMLQKFMKEKKTKLKMNHLN